MYGAMVGSCPPIGLYCRRFNRSRPYRSRTYSRCACKETLHFVCRSFAWQQLCLLFHVGSWRQLLYLHVCGDCGRQLVLFIDSPPVAALQSLNYPMSQPAHTRSWPDAVKLCEELASSRGHAFEPMVELVRSIASSRYSDGMFPSISGETLCIGRTPNFISGKDELRISFDETGQTFTFVHAQRPDEKYPWSLSCPTPEWQSTFERIMHKRLRWFHEG